MSPCTIAKFQNSIYYLIVTNSTLHSGSFFMPLTLRRGSSRLRCLRNVFQLSTTRGFSYTEPVAASAPTGSFELDEDCDARALELEAELELRVAGLAAAWLPSLPLVALPELAIIASLPRVASCVLVQIKKTYIHLYPV